MDLHYKKDGSLDMRYASSKSAANSGSSSSNSSASRAASVSSTSNSTGGYGSTGSGSSYSTSTPSSSSYSTRSSAPQEASSSSSQSSGLVLKKDGTPDMRYASSKAAATSQSPASTSAYSTQPADLHTKKDGSLDMRYSSSKTAAGSQSSEPATASSYRTTGTELHTKKDGSLDMRYKSSKDAAGDTSTSYSNGSVTGTSGVHNKKDGTPDMRYKSSKILLAEMEKLKISSPGDKSLNDGALHVKKDGTLDMRFKINRLATQQNAVLAAQIVAEEENARKAYWEMLQRNAEFLQKWEAQQRTQVTVPVAREYFSDVELQSIRTEIRQLEVDGEMSRTLQMFSKDIPKIEYSTLRFDQNDKLLGKGGFGLVKKATWQYKPVAVKEFHQVDLTKKQKLAFQREVNVMAILGKHDNIVELYGYCLEPLSIIMEYVELGSLSYLLHYCEDKAIEVKMADGRIKRNIVLGVVTGMCLLHEVGIVHGDLKPPNVLIGKDFSAKLTDFGMSVVTGKAATMSKIGTDGKDDGNFAGGTAGYMAPELLDSNARADSKSDVYSFGILLNEVVTEEEPYSDQLRNFAGRGPYAAVNHARQGYRPRIRQNASASLVKLIGSCWDKQPVNRPSFKTIQSMILSAREPVLVPNSF